MQQWSWTASMGGVLAILLVWWGSVAAWEPQKPVELVIPAGPGGGADVMARFIAPLMSKHNLSPQPFVAVNKSGGAGAEGFLYVKGKHADPRHCHHPVKPVYDPSGHWDTVHLERLDPAGTPGPG